MDEFKGYLRHIDALFNDWHRELHRLENRIYQAKLEVIRELSIIKPEPTFKPETDLLLSKLGSTHLEVMTMNDREAYIQKMKAKLDEWSADIRKLEAKADQATADAKLKYNDEIDQLKQKRDEVSDKVDELQKASGNAWDDLKSGVEMAWDSLGTSVRSAVDRFK